MNYGFIYVILFVSWNIEFMFCVLYNSLLYCFKVIIWINIFLIFKKIYVVCELYIMICICFFGRVYIKI